MEGIGCEDGGWKDGGCRVEDGKMRVQDGGYRM